MNMGVVSGLSVTRITLGIDLSARKRSCEPSAWRSWCVKLGMCAMKNFTMALALRSPSYTTTRGLPLTSDGM